MRTLNKKLDALTHENATLTHAMRTQRVDDALEGPHLRIHVHGRQGRLDASLQGVDERSARL